MVLIICRGMLYDDFVIYCLELSMSSNAIWIGWQHPAKMIWFGGGEVVETHHTSYHMHAFKVRKGTTEKLSLPPIRCYNFKRHIDSFQFCVTGLWKAWVLFFFVLPPLSTIILAVYLLYHDIMVERWYDSFLYLS